MGAKYRYDVAYPDYNDLEATDRDGMMAVFNIMCGNIEYYCAIAAQRYSLIVYGLSPSDQGKSYFSTDMCHKKMNHGSKLNRSKYTIQHKNNTVESDIFSQNNTFF